jgi:hypothetical protein
MRAFLSAVAVILLAVGVGGCDKGPSGKYDSSDGMLSVDFKGNNKAAVKIAEGTLDCDYAVEGDKITVVVDKATNHNLVFTKKSADTLDGGPEVGLLTKKKS